MSKILTSVYFSPGKTTEAISKRIAGNVSGIVKNFDLLNCEIAEEMHFTADDILLVTMPVFVGRIPAFCIDALHKLKGKNTPAIAVVVFGNRAYDDALLELVDILQNNGFVVAGAGAFIARHSMFPQVAKGRPDAEDTQKIDAFALQCASLVNGGVTGSVTVPGNHPYKESGPLPIRPTANSTCNKCGTCVKVCPVGAITLSEPQKTNKNLCINCTTCIYACPLKARGYYGIIAGVAKRSFEKSTSDRVEPECFFVDAK